MIKFDSKVMSQIFTAKAIERLRNFLEKANRQTDIEVLTPDASTREYFRVNWNDSTAIACVYPEVFLSKEQTYIDTTNLFLVGGLPVAKIFDFSEILGVIVQEDFGDTILRDVLAESDSDEKENLLNEAITLIAKIQAATTKAFELNSIASRLKFDEEKLFWELNFFKTHYFESLQKQPLTGEENSALTAEFVSLAKELETRAEVLCHRDFHAANLMIDRKNHLRIIDHQDARIGAASYDLVSLLLDRVLEIPDENRLAQKKRFFLAEREKLNLEKIFFADFEREFDLVTVQRCLKAIGTFSNQTANFGKTNYIRYIQPMFRIVLEASAKLNRFPHLQNIIKKQIP
jgi:aminoglycoside/choline kinase family phosphotransferase